MYVIAIIGGRTRTVSDEEILSNLPCPLSSIESIVSGGANGVDRCAASFAKRYGLNLIEIKPNYSQYGMQAPLIRNREIVEAASFAVAFPARKQSKGTYHAIVEAKAADIPVKVVPEGGIQVSLF
jgi:hypothetical protein